MKFLVLISILFSLTGCAVLGYDHNPKYPVFNDGCTHILPITYDDAKSHYHNSDWFNQPHNLLYCADYSLDPNFQLEYTKFFHPALAYSSFLLLF